MSALDEALSRVHALVEKKNSNILHTSELLRQDRELLVRNRWLQEIIRGWYLMVRPDLLPGDSTAWYANFWDFLKVYLKYHYDTEYCISAECSVDFHLGHSVIPQQIIVIAIKGSGIPLQLPYDTSLLVYADPIRLPKEREDIRGLQVMPLAYALCKISPRFFQSSPQDAEIALQAIPSASDLLRVIINNDFKTAAGRLIGAFRFVGNEKMANELKAGLREIGISPAESNPFTHDLPIVGSRGIKSPYVNRIYAMWEQFRTVIIPHIPTPPGLPTNTKDYLKEISELYTQDAYNSLSIEGYHVTKELVEKVRKAEWSPSTNPADKQQRDALAARGYFEAFLAVRESIENILKGASPGQTIEDDLPRWYQKLFSPCVAAGILPAADLFGYRHHQVYIRGSRHTPPAKDYVPEIMNALFQLLKEEEHAGVRAILGHFIFVYIHPYMDGNGRIGRFLMNAMLASGGYPWTIIKVAHRNQYLTSLEAASVHHHILTFTEFVVSEMMQGS